MGVPKNIGDVRHAFARVHYASGISLNSALVRFDDKPAKASKRKTRSPAAWTESGGIGLDNPLMSTQYWRTDVTITPLPPRSKDAIDSLWAIARDPYRPGAFGLYFRGLADPRWNVGDFKAVLVELDLLHVVGSSFDLVAMNLTAKIILAKGAGRTILASPAKAEPVVGHPGRIAVRVELSHFEKAPAGTSWRDISGLSISGTIPSNKLIVHRIRKA